MFIFCWEFCCLFLYIHDIVFLYLGLVWRVQEVVIERWLGLLNIHVIPKWFPSWFVILLCHPTRLGTFMFRIQKKSAKPHRGMMVSDSTQKMIVEFKGQRKLKHYLKRVKRHFMQMRWQWKLKSDWRALNNRVSCPTYNPILLKQSTHITEKSLIFSSLPLNSFLPDSYNGQSFTQQQL